MVEDTKKPDYSDEQPIDDSTEEQKQASREKVIEQRPAHGYELLNASERVLEELERLKSQGVSIDEQRLNELAEAVRKERIRMGRDPRY